MFTDRRGFLLVEALIAVLITSLLASLVCTCINNSVTLEEALEEKRKEMNYLAEETMKEAEICEICVSEEDLDLSWPN